MFRQAVRVRLARVMLLATTFAGGLGCADDADDGHGVRIQLLAPADAARRPDVLRFWWLSPRGVLIDERLPQRGALAGSGPVVATLFIGTHGTLGEPRALVVRGEHDGALVTGGALRIDPTGQPRIERQLALGEPLPDDNGDGVPDQVERNCLIPGGPTCPTPPPPDGGAGDAGDGPGPGGDAATPPDVPAPDDGGGDGRDGPPGDAPDAAPDARPETAPDRQPDTGNPNPVLSQGLVGHWRFEDGPGSAMARDSSANLNNGMLVGISPTAGWIAGRVGGALEIPAADGNGVVVPASASIESITRTFTIAAWTYRTAVRASGLSNVLSRRAAGTTDREYYALTFSDDGRMRGFINTQTSVTNVSSQNMIPLNQWVHVAFVYNGAQLLVYVNGAAAGTANYTQAVGMSPLMPLCLGCAQNQPNNGQAPNESLGGRVDELVLYNRALPVEEIRLLAAGDIPAPP